PTIGALRGANAVSYEPEKRCSRGACAWQNRDAKHACGKSQGGRDETVRGLLLAIGVMVASSAQAEDKINPTDPQPTCPMCPGTYIPSSELEAYRRRSMRSCSTSRYATSISARPISASAWFIAAAQSKGYLSKPA